MRFDIAMGFDIAVLTLLAVAVPVFGAAPKFNVEVVNTGQADVPAGGTIRFEDSYGELNIEAWDEPQMEIVVTRWTYVTDTAAERDRATQELSALHINVEKQGNDLVIRTPRRRRSHSEARLDYRVMVPRSAHLMIQHRVGDLVIGGVEGAIDASVRTGDILLRLPSAVNYSFDADCREGRIHSDFTGVYHRRHLYAEHFTGSGPSAGVAVRLHVGIGGIDIRKLGS